MKRKFLFLIAGVLAAFHASAATVPEMYADRCAQCHAVGIAGAPKVGDRDEWTRRIGPGVTLLYRSALEGMPNTPMMAKGGHRDLTEGDVKALVDYMVAAAGLPASVRAAAARYESLGISNRDFIRLDRNLDGFLSRDEVTEDAALGQNLSRFDTDRDGRLSEAEYIALETTLERERAAEQLDDTTLAAAVRVELDKVKGMPASVKIESAAGVVTMAGVVENAEMARQAYALVKRINGVKRIDNRLVSGHLLSWD